MNWQDEISNAEAGVPRAQVMLTRAEGRSSKRLIAGDIERALREVGIPTEVNIWELLDLYDLPYSAEGLIMCAVYLGHDLTDPDTRREYFGIC